MSRDRVHHAPRAQVEQELAEGPGFVIIRELVDPERVDRALRRLNLEILRCGISARQIDEWKYATFWPTLRWEPEILALRDPIEEVFSPAPGEGWGDAQLLLRFPDEAEDW